MSEGMDESLNDSPLTEQQVYFCTRIASGDSLIAACAKVGVEVITIPIWTEENKTFRGMYSESLLRRSDLYFEKLIDLAEISLTDEKTAANVKVAIDTYRFIIATNSPDKYGAKANPHNSLPGGFTIDTGISSGGNDGHSNGANRDEAGNHDGHSVSQGPETTSAD